MGYYGDNQEVLEVALVRIIRAKEVIVRRRLGLRNHITCGDLSLHEAVIILEDDLFVSPAFYDFYKHSGTIESKGSGGLVRLSFVSMPI
jgi:hypothetical protein